MKLEGVEQNFQAINKTWTDHLGEFWIKHACKTLKKFKRTKRTDLRIYFEATKYDVRKLVNKEICTYEAGSEGLRRNKKEWHKVCGA
jgi:hypothetical protein